MALQVDWSAVLGEGVFATVYKARDVDKGIDLAVKVYNDDYGGHDSKLHQCRTECAFLKRLSHNNIIKALGIVNEGVDSPVFLLMQFAPSGDLHSRLMESAGGGIEPSAAMEIIRGITSALVYLHDEHKFMHGDIKPENVLLDGDKALVCDFDATLKFGTKLDPPRGTRAYHPPEFYDASGNSTSSGENAITPIANGAADVWAASMVNLMIFTGFDPESLAAPDNCEFWRWRVPAAQGRDRRRSPWGDFGSEMQRLVIDVLGHQDPEKRLSAAQIASRLDCIAQELTEEMLRFRKLWIARGTTKADKLDDYEDEDVRLLGTAMSPAAEDGSLVDIIYSVCGRIRGAADDAGCNIM